MGRTSVKPDFKVHRTAFLRFFLFIVFLAPAAVLAQDVTPPEAVASFVASTGGYVGALSLSWPAAADDGGVGALAAGSTYYIQYATYPAVAWSTGAAQVVGSTSGVTPSSLVTYVMGGLDPGTTYYAAVWHRDESGNLSAVSNIASGYAKPFPGGTFTRTALSGGRWELKFNSAGNGSDLISNMVTDASGNIYASGFAYNGSNQDLALHKYAPDGTLLMAKYYNSPENCGDSGEGAVAVDNADGSFYLSGGECRSNGGHQGVMMKFDGYGNRLWIKRLPGLGGITSVQALNRMIIDASGNIYVSGTMTNGSNNMDQYVGKFDKYGNELWSNTSNTTSNTEVNRGIVIVGTSVYCAGYADQSGLGQSNNAYARKLSSSTGVTQWTSVYNSTYSLSDGFAIVGADSSGGIYFAGQQQVGGVDRNSLVQKFNEAGALQWNYNYNLAPGYNENVVDLTVGADGVVYLAGFVFKASGFSDMKVAGITQNGVLLGQFTYSGGAGSDEAGVLISSGPYLLLGGRTFGAGTSDNFYIRKMLAYDVVPPVPAAAALSGLAAGVSSITWSWGAADYAAGYRLGPSTVSSLSGDLSSTTFSWADTGLAVNTGYTRFLSVFSSSGVAASSATRYTLANPPSGFSTSAVYVTSAVFNWGLNGNPAGTTAQFYRSTDSVSYSLAASTPGLTFADTGLQACASSYLLLRNINGDGVQTAAAGPLTVFTRGVPAQPGSGLSAEALAGGKIVLNWALSPSSGVSKYRLYYDAGTGTVNYSAPLAELQPSATSYITAVLPSSAAYTFALRAVNGCGEEEQNAHVLAAAPSVPALAGVKASIKEPHSGKKVSGNRLTVIAEITSGEQSLVDRVLFQYRVSGGVWAGITAANVNHPNPDSGAPYFVHWDVSALAAGNYDLRAVAYDIYGSSDPSPAAITVKVDNADFEVKETEQGDGKVKKEQLITNTVASVVSAADQESSWVTKVSVPPAAVSAATVTLAIINNPVALPSQDSVLSPVGQSAEITLSNGQHLLDNGRTAEVILTYPDDNGDGIVDGTFIRAERLKIYSYDSSAGNWKADLSCSVDKEKRQVIGNTAHFSYFAVFAPMAASVSSVRAYPNPWKPGSGGRFDAAAVTFDSLPSSALIQVFTIAGELVRELHVTAADSGVKAWDGRNGSGSKAASGVYIVLVRSGGKNKTLKLGVER